MNPCPQEDYSLVLGLDRYTNMPNTQQHMEDIIKEE